MAISQAAASSSLRSALSAKVVVLYRQICRDIPRFFIMCVRRARAPGLTLWLHGLTPCPPPLPPLLPSSPNRYGVEGYSHADARRLILLNHFRKNSAVTDPRLIEMLLERARQEVEETNQQWKQKPHIMALLEPEVEAVDPWDPEEFRRLCVGRELETRCAQARAHTLASRTPRTPHPPARAHSLAGWRRPPPAWTRWCGRTTTLQCTRSAWRGWRRASSGSSQRSGRRSARWRR